MGQTFARYKSRNQRRVLLVGLDAAGKTTLLFRLYSGKTLNTVPTVGYNVKTFTFQGLNMNVWDVGGQDHLREFWRHHFTGTQGLIYVVDSSDRDRLQEAAQQFESVVSDLQLNDAAILILANKQDLPNAASSEEVTEIFQINQLLNGRKCHVQPTTATTNQGITEGMSWLANNMERL